MEKNTFNEKNKKNFNLKKSLKESSKYTDAMCLKQKLKLDPIWITWRIKVMNALGGKILVMHVLS